MSQKNEEVKNSCSGIDGLKDLKSNIHLVYWP